MMKMTVSAICSTMPLYPEIRQRRHLVEKASFYLTVQHSVMTGMSWGLGDPFEVVGDGAGARWSSRWKRSPPSSRKSNSISRTGIVWFRLANCSSICSVVGPEIVVDPDREAAESGQRSAEAVRCSIGLTHAQLVAVDAGAYGRHSDAKRRPCHLGGEDGHTATDKPVRSSRLATFRLKLDFA